MSTVDVASLTPQLQAATPAALQARLSQRYNENGTPPVPPNPNILNRDEPPGSAWWQQARTAGTPENTALVDYASLSVLGHCDDAWSYLSGSTKSLLASDPWTASHLAYYSELRAAQCLILSSGVFVRNRVSLYFESNGAGKQLRLSTGGACSLGTHKVVWPLFETWAKVRGVSQLNSVLSLCGVTLTDLESELPFSLAPTMENFLRKCGVDLLELSKDHSSRNRCSYNPTTLFGRVPTAIPELQKVVSDAWTLSSDALQERLALNLIWLAFAAAGNNNKRVLADLLVEKLTVLGGNVSAAQSLHFESRFDSDFMDASPYGPIFPQNNFELGVWARAFVMCVLSSLITRSFLTNSTMLSSPFIAGWWRSQGTLRALFDETMIADIQDIHADIQERAQKSIQLSDPMPTGFIQLSERLTSDRCEDIGSFGSLGIVLAYA